MNFQEIVTGAIGCLLVAIATYGLIVGADRQVQIEQSHPVQVVQP